jgi:membrane protein YqaA with SNARE-associated domain
MWRRLYDWVLHLAAHQHAPMWLVGLSVAESSFFPLPVDIMLAPMVMAQPQRAWFYAGLTTVGSVLGGVAGFFIGYWLLDAVLPMLQEWGYGHAYDTARGWFLNWGFWAVFLAGFTPIPYKVFTIAAGAAGMFLPVFVAASIVGRGGRFFLVALLVRWGGPRVEPHLKRYMDQIAWSTLAVLMVAFMAYRAF